MIGGAVVYGCIGEGVDDGVENHAVVALDPIGFSPVIRPCQACATEIGTGLELGDRRWRRDLDLGRLEGDGPLHFSTGTFTPAALSSAETLTAVARQDFLPTGRIMRSS